MLREYFSLTAKFSQNSKLLKRLYSIIVLISTNIGHQVGISYYLNFYHSKNTIIYPEFDMVFSIENLGYQHLIFDPDLNRYKWGPGNFIITNE